MTRVTSILIEKLAASLLTRLARGLARRAGPPDEAIRLIGGTLRGADGESIGLMEAVRRLGRKVATELTYEATAEDSMTVHTVQAAEVEVDAETGAVLPRRLVSVHEAGRIVNRRAFESQIEGGVVQGLGYALTEGLMLDDGRVVNVNLHEYKIPTSRDVPSLETIVITDEELGVTPIGEGTVGTAPAIVNALVDALGSRTYDLPITPEAVIAAARAGRQ